MHKTTAKKQATLLEIKREVERLQYTTTANERADWRAAINRCQPDPWIASESAEPTDWRINGPQGTVLGPAVGRDGIPFLYVAASTMHFIMMARSAMPRLLAQVDHLETKLADAEKRAAQWQAAYLEIRGEQNKVNARVAPLQYGLAKQAAERQASEDEG